MTKSYNQWDSDTIGSPIAGVTARNGGTPARLPIYGTPVIKKRYLAFATSNTTNYGDILSIDAIDSDANRANFNILTCFKVADATVDSMCLYGRGQGAGAITDVYRCNIEFTTNLVRLSKLVAGVNTVTITGSSATVTWANAASWFVRFDGQGTTLRWKAWDAALGMAGEPAAYNVTVTDASLSAAGWVGYGARHGTLTGRIAPFNFISVGTNGDSAPCPRTNAEYLTWLDDQSMLHCVLAEMSATGYDSSGAPFTKVVNAYASNLGYVSAAWDSPASQHYQEIIAAVPTFSRQTGVDLIGQTTITFGDLVIRNERQASGAGGVRDDWLRMKWSRNFLKMWLGDQSWPRHDFRQIVCGRLGQPLAPAPDQIKFPIADLSDLFNAPLQTSRFTTGDYINQLKPIFMGQVGRASHNGGQIEPPLTDSANLIYTLSDAAVGTWYQSITNYMKCYDNQVELRTASLVIASVAGNAITTTLAHGMVVNYLLHTPVSGTLPAPLVNDTDYWVQSVPGSTSFTLSATRGGAVITLTNTNGAGTTSLRGYGYTVTVAGPTTIQLAANPAGRVTVSDVLTSSSGAYATGATSGNVYKDIVTRLGLSTNFIDPAQAAFLADVGLWVDTNSHTGTEIMQQHSQGTLTGYGFTPDGLFGSWDVQLPLSTAVMALDEDDVKENSLKLTQVIRPVDFSVAVVSQYPWFLTGGPFQTGSQAALQGKSFAAPFSYGASSTPLDNYPSLSDPNTTYTIDFLYTTAYSYHITLYKQKLGIFEFETRLKASQLAIGQTIQLTHSRMGWKTWSAGDPASADNTATIDSTKAVVIGIDTNLEAPGPFKTKLTVFRQIPGSYPTANVN